MTKDKNFLRKIKEDINRFFGESEKGVGDIDYGTSREFVRGLGSMPINYPDMDIKDDGENLIIRFDMPGVDKEDIRINIEEDLVEVKADRRIEREDREEDYYKLERSYRGFYRKTKLPEEILPEKTRARYENGVLTIIAPKSRIGRSTLEVE